MCAVHLPRYLPIRRLRRLSSTKRESRNSVIWTTRCAQLIDEHDKWQGIHDILHTYRDALKRTLTGDEAKTNKGQEQALRVLLAIR